MSRGGVRIGSGRPPKTRHERWLGGNAGRRPFALVTGAGSVSDGSQHESSTSSTPLNAPAELTPSELVYWQRFAPLADKRGMLSPGTVPGLVLLCQLVERSDRMKRTIDRTGLLHEKITTDKRKQKKREYKAHPLLSHYTTMAGRIEQLMARYGLASDGKVFLETPKPKDDERERLNRLLSSSAR